MKEIFIPLFLIQGFIPISPCRHSQSIFTQMGISKSGKIIQNSVVVRNNQKKILLRNYHIAVGLDSDILKTDQQNKSRNILRTASDSHQPQYFDAGVHNQGFTLDELWQLSTGSPIISLQLSDLNWGYDEFRSNVRLGNHSGIEIGSRFITLDGHTDLSHGMLAFTYQLNNALNTEQTAILADKAANGKISEADFSAGCGIIESAGVVDQAMVALEMNVNADMPFFLVNMVQGYQSGEFDLPYLQNWAYSNYIKDKIFTVNGVANLPAATVPAKAIALENIDGFLQTLHNRDVRLAIELVAPEKEFDNNGKYHPSSIQRILTSVNVKHLNNAYPTYLLIGKLVKLLNDPEKDWYANLLLYNLTGKLPPIPPADVLRVETRMEWLKPMPDGRYSYKSGDVKMWEKYFTGLTKSKKG